MSLPAESTTPLVVDPSVATPTAATTAAAAPDTAAPAITAPAAVAPAAAALVTAPTMSSDSMHTLGSYSHLPMLTRDNYQKWRMAVRAFLTPYDHVRVISSSRDAAGNLSDPVCPTNAAELKAWETSEGIAMGIVSGTTYDLHADLVASHEGGHVLDLWKAIEGQHTTNDLSLRHQAWNLLFGHHMAPNDELLDYWRKGADIKARIDCITPHTLSSSDVIMEIYLFAQIAGLCPDDPLRHHFISRPIPSEAEVYAAFLRVSTDKKTTAQIETANAAYSPNCHRCLQPGHFAKECPHAEALNKLVTHRLDPNRRKGKPRSQQGGSGTNANAASTTPSSTAPKASTSAPAPTQESAGVATSFLSSRSPRTDHSLIDSGASSSMTGDRSAFLSLQPDRHAIRLADGRIIYSKGVGSICFLSDCGYLITINDALYVPSLAASLFVSNRFAQEHRETYSESMEFPLRRWVNRQSGATEFSATIRAGDLAYLNWKPSPSIELANVSIAELHSCLNHMPRSAIQRLARTGSLAGLPDNIPDDPDGDFCENCVNGKLTRAPHTKPAARAEHPLA